MDQPVDQPTGLSSRQNCPLETALLWLLPLKLHRTLVPPSRVCTAGSVEGRVGCVLYGVAPGLQSFS